MLSVFFQQASAFLFLSGIVIALCRILFLSVRINNTSMFSLTCIAGILVAKLILYQKYFNKTIFEWTSTQFIPLITAYLGAHHLLEQDFYLSSVRYSPFKLFVHPILCLEELGISWPLTLLMIKLSLFFLTPVVAFLAMKVIYDVVKAKDTSAVASGFIIFAISIFVSGGYVVLQGLSSKPAGWSNILINQMVAPMTVSAAFGLMYLFEKYRNKESVKFNFSILFLILATLTHPAMGIFVWIIRVLFDLKPLRALIKDKALIVEMGMGLILPVALIILAFPQEATVTGQQFFEIYVRLRHPHHYMVSRMSIGDILLYLMYMLIPFYFGKVYGFKEVKQLSVRIISVYLLVIGTQFIGSELIPIKFIMKIGPVRFTVFIGIVIALQYCQLFSYLSTVWDDLLARFNKLYRSKMHYFIYCVVVLLVSFALIFNFVQYEKDPFLSLPQENQDILNYLLNNTSRNAQIHVIKFDANAVRTFAKRSVLIDDTFPFNEAAMLEFKDRFRRMLKGKNISVLELRYIKRKYNVSHVLAPAQTFPKANSIFSSGSWSVWYLDDIVHAEEVTIK